MHKRYIMLKKLRYFIFPVSIMVKRNAYNSSMPACHVPEVLWPSGTHITVIITSGDILSRNNHIILGQLGCYHHNLTWHYQLPDHIFFSRQWKGYETISIFLLFCTNTNDHR